MRRCDYHVGTDKTLCGDPEYLVLGVVAGESVCREGGGGRDTEREKQRERQRQRESKGWGSMCDFFCFRSTQAQPLGSAMFLKVPATIHVGIVYCRNDEM